MEENLPPADQLPEEPHQTSRRTNYAFYITQLLVLGGGFFWLLNHGNYGWTLFCFIPFSIGLTVGTYTRTFQTKKLMKGTAVTSLIIIVISLLLLFTGFEGAICILMAIGLLVLPALLGVLIGYWLRNAFKLLSILAIGFITSSSMVYDYKSSEQVRSIASESTIVNASRQKIWQVLTGPVRFSAHPNVFFRAGVSYPTGMLLGEGSNHCLFLNCSYNNGNTQLLIEKLDSLKCMRFSMKEEIVTMTEMTFYDKLSAPHLKGYFKPAYGEFSISEISPGKCRLTASTAYSYKITPAFYWHWWTDYLANAMHRQVLQDIKQQAEK